MTMPRAYSSAEGFMAWIREKTCAAAQKEHLNSLRLQALEFRAVGASRLEGQVLQDIAQIESAMTGRRQAEKRK